MVRRDAYSLSICTTLKGAEDDGEDVADDLVLLLEDAASGMETGTPMDAGGCERAWMDDENSGLLCTDSSVPVNPCRGISDEFGISAKAMSKEPRGYEEDEKSQAASSRSNGWFEVAKGPILG